MQMMSGRGQSVSRICGLMRTALAATNESACAETITGRTTPEVAWPSMMTRQSRPADMNMSYMPNTTEATESRAARMATLAGFAG